MLSLVLFIDLRLAFVCSFIFFEEECYYIAQAGLEVMTLPSYPSQDHSHASAHTKV